MALNVHRKSVKFVPDPKRVITRFFMPGREDRAQSIIQRIVSLPDDSCRQLFNDVLRNFSKRHRNISIIFENSFENVQHLLDPIGIEADALTREQKLLIGSYFTQEYSVEAAAFFNPSIVEDPYQGNLNNGQLRVIVSFRATGEGHISSIVFRSGTLDSKNNLSFAPAGNFVDVPEMVKRHVYEKAIFLRKLGEMRIVKDVVGMVMDRLGDNFIYGELLASIEETRASIEITPSKEKVLQAINWLASSHYEISFSLDTDISERVIFPVSYSESNGIEDARFVKFTGQDGRVTYYATYTAYNGYTILPKLMETEDFCHFKIMPLHGNSAHNKGLALFPRQIGGKYAMISRCDGENIFVMFSDNINLWPEAVKIGKPFQPEEFVQMGTAGSPIETDRGWLLITHGVGPVRTYTLGAALLDLDDPTRVIAYLNMPFLVPTEEEREGYVPNVVYSCGSIVHNGELIIPYGMSDYCSSFATVSLDDLLGEMTPV
jgi:predicted GH43/DUF377 family glycosyl hydrolase